jgi:hypothetical protein
MVARLFERYVRGGVAHEQHRHQQGGDRDRRAGDDEYIARGERSGQPAAESSRERDAAITGGLVEAEREATAIGSDEVDLHDHGHGPREPLIDTQQRVGSDDPAPARRDRDHEWDRQRERPAGDQQPPAPGPRGSGSREEIRQRLGDAEGDDEREHCRARAQAEVLLPDERQRRALEPDHRSHERVDGDQQRELGGVLAQPELDGGRLGHRR